MADESENSLHGLVSAIEKIGVHDHVCLIYETQEEQFAVVIPFMRIGLERGEKCMYIVDDNTAAMVIAAMKSAGLDVDSAVESGQLVIVSKQESYLKQGYFDPDWMISFLKNAIDKAKAEGFSALRVTGETTWVLGGEPGTERLIEYDAKLNYFFPDNDVLAICQYNRSRFAPKVIKDVITTHPLVISGGLVCDNFYYIPPGDFLEETPVTEIDRLLDNIKSREKVEKELQRNRERLKELVVTIQTISAEKTYLCSCATQENVNGFAPGAEAAPGQIAPELTKREQEVLKLTAEGYNTKESAFELGLSVKMIETHRKHIKQKLKLKNVAQLVTYAARTGMISLN